VLNDEFYMLLKESESERLAFRLFFGHETIETLTAFANSQGGILLLGISESKEIKGIRDTKEVIDQWLNEILTRTAPRLLPHVEILEIDKKLIVCFSVAEYPVKPVAFEGKYYKRLNKYTRELSIREAINFRRQSIGSYWDSGLRRDKTIADLSFKKLYRLIERISYKKQCPMEEPLAFLRKYSLSEGDAITNACWLLFLPEEEAKSTIELGRFSSPTVTSDTLTLKTDLFTEAEEAMRFICKHICKTPQTNAPVQWQYPLEAIRELVVNMIIHRDYTSDYSSIIKIFDGYIEFYNSGALPDDLSIKHLLANKYISRPRNPQIAELFKDAGMFGEYGSGIRQVYAAFTDNGLRPPEFVKLPDRLIVRVYEDVKENLSVDSDPNPGPDIEVDLPKEEEDITVHFSDREQKIIALIVKDKRILLNEIARKLTVSKRTILRDVKKMKEEKIIERIGSEKSGYWKINTTLTGS